MIFATLYIPSDLKKKKHEKQNTGVLHGSLKSEHQSGFNGGGNDSSVDSARFLI